MSWQQLIVEPEAALRDAVEEQLLEAGALAVTLEDAGNEPLLEPAPGETPVWKRARLIALFGPQADVPAHLEQLRSTLGCDALRRARIERLHERVWELEWRRDYRPMRFGQRLWVSPADALGECPGDAVTVVLEPGLAFGTGTHPTTALCLRWLDGHAVAGRRVLDYGCGSGILAVAAAALGASEVTATDIDWQALQATRENAQRNGVRGLDVCEPAALPRGCYDVVLANILAGTLRHLAPELAARTAAGGDLVLSGLLLEQGEEVMSAYRPWFEFLPMTTLGEWCLLHGVKRRDAQPLGDAGPGLPYVTL